MTQRRGLTLIEVLIAVTILATLAAACAPVIARSLGLLQGQPTMSLFELSRLADAVMAEPEAFGIDDWRSVTSISVVPTERLNLDAVRVEVLSPRAAGLSHAWVRFTGDDGLSVYRWLHQPHAEEGDM